jgi:hypothetical protein
MHRLCDLIGATFHRFGLVLKDLNRESRYLLDSFPVPVCDSIRISRCRLVHDECFRGYLASKRRYFYGVRVQVITKCDGVPVGFAVLPGRFADIDGFAHLLLELPESAHLICDSAYTQLNGKSI